jgi:molybdopterin/thiamine biosynthesis adenylyltransferase
MSGTFVHEEEYRGEDLLNKIGTQSVTLCGVGAIGSNFADSIVRQGFKNITAIDMDRITDHNRSTQIWGSRDIGQFKVTVLRNMLFNSMKIGINPVNKRLDINNVSKLMKKDSIIIDGFDEPESRKIVSDYCSLNQIECLHLGLSEDCAEVTWQEKYHIPKKSSGLDVCEYALARNIVLLCVTVGVESLIRYINSGVRESYLISLKDFSIVRY